MATFPLSWTNVDVPDNTGSHQYTWHYYGSHPQEYLWVWRPTGWDTTGFKDKPCIVHLHGGLGNSVGNNSLAISAGGWVDTMHTTHGWPVVSIEYPSVHDNSDQKLEAPHSKLWPYALHSVARAIAYLKGNASPDVHGAATAGVNQAVELWGVDGNGDANTIAPAYIVLDGFSYGATLAFLMAAVPNSALDIPRDLPLGLLPFQYASDARPRAVVGLDGQVDWTQFSFNPTQTTGTYRDNCHQVFHRRDDKRQWGETYLSPGATTVPSHTVPMAWKRDASPWWWFAKAYPEAKGTAVLGKWEKNPSSDPDQQNLTHLDWSPGSQRLEQDLGKAWYDPHLNFQAKPLGDLLDTLGIQNAMLWGSSSTNPLPGLNLDDHSFNTFVPDWLLNTVGIPA